MKNCNGTWLPDGDTFFEPWGDYESHDYAHLMPFISKHRIAIDVGAHVGFWSRRLVQDFSYVYAFEPDPEHVQCLMANVTKPNITVMQVALSNISHTLKFSKAIENSGMSHIAPEGVDVQCEPLDRWNIQDVDLIKIDVEGHEISVLHGAEKTILRSRPVLFIEILDSAAADLRNGILDLMAEWNYELKSVTHENYIFVSAE
jgi:FkbM family methyltransferase